MAERTRHRVNGASYQFPQLGAAPERHTVLERATGLPKMTAAGNVATALRFPGGVNLGGGVERAVAMQNFAHSLRTADPESLRSGPEWYPKVNTAVAKGIGTGRGGFLRGASDRMLSGAGIVAAVSPNMDWEQDNIHAFSELKGLRSQHWNAIMGGSKQESADAVRGLSISKSPRKNLQKAGRLIAGEDPHTIIPGQTAPKTHAFMHNIADPSDPHHVTVDARVWDTMTNRQRPWEFNRLLTTRPRGEPETRYGQAQSVVQTVARHMDMDPSAAQATSWESVRRMEQSGTTLKGKPRKQGAHRTGQPYYHPVTGDPVPHMSGQFNGV